MAVLERGYKGRINMLQNMEMVKRPFFLEKDSDLLIDQIRTIDNKR
jgi:hypothetical protein